MAFSRVKTYYRLVLDVQLDAPAVLSFYTERGLIRELTLAATVGRAPVKVALPGNALGRYAQLKLAPTGIARLFGVLLYGKVNGEAGETSWSWSAGPVDPTPDQWTVQPLPIPQTPEEYSTQPLPIPQTPEDWTEAKLPIPPTPEDWNLFPLPVPATADAYDWAEIPVDA